MSQKPGGFAAGHGLLAAAKTLNFSSGRSALGGVSSGVSGRGQEQVGGQVSAEHLGSTMKLFSSLGLSPSDLDALAQIPEDQISVETLPHILRQLKSRKSRDGYGDWDEPREGSREGPGRELSYRQVGGAALTAVVCANGTDFHFEVVLQTLMKIVKALTFGPSLLPAYVTV